MKHIRISIAVIVSALLSLGVVMIFSSSGVYAFQELGSSSYFLQRHLLYLFFGLAGMFAMMTFDYRLLARYAKPLLLLAIFLLVLVLIPGIGREISGARRWFRFFGLSVQPSEFAKIAMLIYISDFLARKKDQVKSFHKGALPALIALGTVCLLILKQPDLGTSILIGAVSMVLFFLAGMQLYYFGILGILAVPAFYFLVMRVPYRLRRILAFLDPWQDQLGSGFQLIQSQIALGSGGLFGVGLGRSLQKLFYLPAAHTDFILSIIGEELGLVGTLTVVILFMLFIFQGTRIAKRTEDPFGFFLAIGIVLTIGLQAIVNIGVSIGALPTKGLPLPFISFGGSALIAQLMCVGILLNISRIQDLS